MTRDSFTMRRCALAGVQAVEARSSHSFPRHRHDSYGVGLMIGGAHRSWSGRGSVEAERGDIITCNPEEVHDGVPISTTREWKILYLSPRIVGKAIADIREEGSADFEFSSPVIKSRVHISIFEATYRSMSGADADVESARERLILLLVGLLSRRPRTLTAIPSAIAHARSRIDDDPLSSVTLDELAREVRMSRFQLLRGFLKATGFTPHAYLVQRRLEIARRLIVANHPLADVALASGFADQSHFTRRFVARYGVTPKAFAHAIARSCNFVQDTEHVIALHWVASHHSFALVERNHAHAAQLGAPATHPFDSRW